MGYRYDVAVAFRLDQWKDKILPKITEKISLDEFYCDRMLEYKDSFDGWNYIILEWSDYKRWADPFDNDISIIIDKMTEEYLCDYIVIGEGQEIIKEKSDFCLLNYQSMVPLLPDELYLQESWRAIDKLKNYLKDNYGLQPSQIDCIIKGKV